MQNEHTCWLEQGSLLIAAQKASQSSWPEHQSEQSSHHKHRTMAECITLLTLEIIHQLTLAYPYPTGYAPTHEQFIPGSCTPRIEFLVTFHGVSSEKWLSYIAHSLLKRQDYRWASETNSSENENIFFKLVPCKEYSHVPELQALQNAGW